MVYSEEELRLVAQEVYETRVNSWSIFKGAVDNNIDDTNLGQEEPHAHETMEHEFPPKFDIAGKK